MFRLPATVFLTFFCGAALSQSASIKSYADHYLAFYPTQAARLGKNAAVLEIENFEASAVDEWVDLNRQVLEEAEELIDNGTRTERINARLVRVQALKEIYRWNGSQTISEDPQVYLQPVSRAFSNISGAGFLLTGEKPRLRCDLLPAMTQLLDQVVHNVESVSLQNAERTKGMLDGIRRAAEEFQETDPCAKRYAALVGKLTALEKHLASATRNSESTVAIGQEEYARRLKLYTDSDLSPEKLEEMALAEIDLVRGLIMKRSRAYLQETYPGREFQDSEIIAKAFADMEADVPEGSQDYLEFWLDLAEKAKTFIAEKRIATLPANETLAIEPAPESAGAAARIGWVSSAPPLAPNPLTTLFLPSIPETLPKQEQIDFWSSFNKPFNRMIVIHELFPGHYMQLKIARETPYPERLIFPYQPYIEGWATFAERVLLDEGWEAERPLTYLAHLRKRIENANRAYTSVQVHCNGWDQEQVMKFSIEKSLLAPQFAKSLWGRIEQSPMQLTSYYLGGAQISAVLEAEKQRLGDNFDLLHFMDTLLKAGAIPVDELPGLLNQSG